MTEQVQRKLSGAEVQAIFDRSPFIGWLSFVVFLTALVIYVSWRRAALRERRGRVFDREAKTTDETGTRSDQ